MTAVLDHGDGHSHRHDHDHDHDHGHDHGHDHDLDGDAHDDDRREAVPVGGPAVLDIGGDIGALVLHLDRSHLGTEIHIRPAGRPADPTTHTGVWERIAGGRTMVVAVFPAVQEGQYDVLDARGEPCRSVVITGGEVAEAEVIQSGSGGELDHDHFAT